MGYQVVTTVKYSYIPNDEFKVDLNKESLHTASVERKKSRIVPRCKRL